MATGMDYLCTYVFDFSALLLHLHLCCFFIFSHGNLYFIIEQALSGMEANHLDIFLADVLPNLCRALLKRKYSVPEHAKKVHDVFKILL